MHTDLSEVDHVTVDSVPDTFRVVELPAIMVMLFLFRAGFSAAETLVRFLWHLGERIL